MQITFGEILATLRSLEYSRVIYITHLIGLIL